MMGMWKARKDGRIMIGVVGVPGAGKSCTARRVADEVASRGIETRVLPMDGFHYYRSQLDAFEDPKMAHARRGAHWVRDIGRNYLILLHDVSTLTVLPALSQTFDAARFLAHIKALRSHVSLAAPSFDHGVGDPVEEDIFIPHNVPVILVEGNYLLLETGPWGEIKGVSARKAAAVRRGDCLVRASLGL